MASSDDEGEAVPDAVTNYHFVNERDEPVSFSELPVQWNDGEVLDGKGKQIFLHGHADIQKIYKQVVAWKFDLSDAKPQILVLSKEKIWMKLQKPRKSYEDTIRTILITVHCLHSARKNPELSGKSLWDQLSKVFSLYEVRPSENDLIDHANMISEAVEKDETLKKSKFLVPFLEEKPRKKKALDEDIGATTNFIVDDDMIEEFEEYDGSDEEDDLFDSVCAICDNGGDILCCEGRCMRSFHATVEAGADSSCESLGLTNEQVEAIQSFFCKNCQYKRHQCFFCGELGSSDKSTGAEVFPCVSATCGRFYHPRCVSKLLHRESAAEAEELQTKIAHGESFTCPVHRCIVCKQGENKMDPDLQFAVCRRCPKSYHRKCLPKKIAFEDVDDEDIIQRAWEGLIPNRILIYCLKHEIDDELGTPIRKHIKFPDDGQKNKKQILERLQKKEKVLQKKRVLDSADACRKGSHEKLQKGVDLPSVKAEDGSSKKTVRRLPSPNPLKKQKGGDSSIKALNRSASTKVTKSIDEKKVSLGNMLYDIHFIPGSTSVKSKKEETPDSEPKQTVTDKPVAKERDDSFPLDDASKKKILTLVKNASSSITLEKIIANHKMPTTDGYSSRNVVDKSLTLGKVQGTVEAICAALEKLKDGGSVEDAKIVCEPELLNQIVRWKSKIGGYISPFLNGARYTSFGRHFTKVDKLKEIVDLLHCYVQDGDMMVDFCCGSNDFSWLMKEKLEKIGTKCSYKNYDLVQAKNDFNFEKRDWMTVHPKELPSGSKLIMGLNPPFGKNARDANKFIDKALEFKPKLLILIAPPQTERLDKKDPPYDLIWEDDEMLAGKSFYLPGSIDVNHNQLDDWNVTTSLLNLWSRSDWTAKHKAIAQKHGHLSRLQQTNSETELETLVSDVAVEVHDLNSKIPFSIDVNPVRNVAREAHILGSDKEGFPSNKDEKEVREHNNSSQGKNHSNGDSKKRRRDKGKRGRESGEMSPALKEKGINHERGRSDKRKRGRESSEMSPALKEKGPSQERGRSDKGKRGRESAETSPAVKERALSQERTLTETYNKLPRLSPQIGSRRRSLEDARSSEPPEFGHYGTGYGENRENDIDITHGWPSGTSPSRGRDYGVRNPVEQFPGYQRETMDGVRNPLEQFPGYQRDTMDNHGRRTYVAGLEQNCATDSSIRAHLGLYGQQQQQYPDALGGQRIDRYSVGGDPGQQQQQYPDALGGQRIDRYSVGGDPGYSLRYGQLGPSAGPSYDQMSNAMSMSTMSRYAPQLNEMNHMRVNPLAAVPPSHTLGRNVIPDAFAPPVGYRGDPMGFPPDPYRHFPQYNNSPGW